MSSHPLRKGELVQSPGRGGWTVYEADSDSLHVLNETARAIWELCDGDTSPDEMAHAIADLTDLDLEEATREVTETLSLLDDLGLVSR